MDGWQLVRQDESTTRTTDNEVIVLSCDKFQMTEIHLSQVVAKIYDCALDASNWPGSLRSITDYVGCHTGSLTVLDRADERPRLVSLYQDGKIPTDMVDMHTRNNYGVDAAGFFERAMALPGFELNEPIAASRVIDQETYKNLPVVREWAGPQGFCDVMSLVVLETAERLGTVDLIAHERHGPFTDLQLGRFRQLAPHLRRVIAITNLIEREAADKQVLKRTLDGVATAVFLVAPDARIVHANSAGEALFREGIISPAEAGCLPVVSGPQRNSNVPGQSHGPIFAEVGPMDAPIVIRLMGKRDGDAPIVGHVLPLLGSWKSQDCIAAVFVARDQGNHVDHAHVSASLGLTPAEWRIVAKLTSGASIADAAIALGITISTARTHLSRVFAKTGTSRQGELVALVTRISSPSARRS